MAHSLVLSKCTLTFKRTKWHVPSIYFSGPGRTQLWREIGSNEYRVCTLTSRFWAISAANAKCSEILSMVSSQSRPRVILLKVRLILSRTKKAQGLRPDRSLNGLSILEDKLDKDPRRLVIFLPGKSYRYVTVPCWFLLFQTPFSQNRLS